jgi:hypothetical protein
MSPLRVSGGQRSPSGGTARTGEIAGFCYVILPTSGRVPAE